MSTERLEMRRIREILRLRWQEGLKVRQVASSIGRSVGVVQKVLSRAEKAGLDWAAAEALQEGCLERKLYGVPVAATPIVVATARRLGVKLLTADKILRETIPFVVW
jgi:hypothetical protein